MRLIKDGFSINKRLWIADIGNSVLKSKGHCYVETWQLKSIFSDSNSTFLLHKSVNINKNMLFRKFQLILILHECMIVHWPCSID